MNMTKALRALRARPKDHIKTRREILAKLEPKARALQNATATCVYCGEPKHTPAGDSCPKYDREHNR
jgi:hypothetical protein